MMQGSKDTNYFGLMIIREKLFNINIYKKILKY